MCIVGVHGDEERDTSAFQPDVARQPEKRAGVALSLAGLSSSAMSVALKGTQ
jgi:hypothetical protein